MSPTKLMIEKGLKPGSLAPNRPRMSEEKIRDVDAAFQTSVQDSGVKITLHEIVEENEVPELNNGPSLDRSVPTTAT